VPELVVALSTVNRDSNDEEDGYHVRDDHSKKRGVIKVQDCSLAAKRAWVNFSSAGGWPSAWNVALGQKADLAARAVGLVSAISRHPLTV